MQRALNIAAYRMVNARHNSIIIQDAINCCTQQTLRLGIYSFVS